MAVDAAAFDAAGSVILAGEKPGGGRVDFCWLVWSHDHVGAPEMRWLHRDGRVAMKIPATSKPVALVGDDHGVTFECNAVSTKDRQPQSSQQTGDNSREETLIVRIDDDWDCSEQAINDLQKPCWS
jgi:hypothetical protein